MIYVEDEVYGGTDEQVYNTDYKVWRDDEGRPYIFFQTIFGFPSGGYKVFEDGAVHYTSAEGFKEDVIPDAYISFADADEDDGYPLPTVRLYVNCSSLGAGWVRDCSPQEFGAELLKVDFGSPPRPALQLPVPQQPPQQPTSWLDQWENFTRVGQSRGYARIINLAPGHDQEKRLEMFHLTFSAARRRKSPVMVTMTFWHKFARGELFSEEAEWIGFPALNVVVYIAVSDGARAATGPRAECAILCLEADNIPSDFGRLRIDAPPPPPPPLPAPPAPEDFKPDDEEKEYLSARRQLREQAKAQSKADHAAARAKAISRWESAGGVYQSHPDIENKDVREAVEKIECELSVQESIVQDFFKALQDLTLIQKAAIPSTFQRLVVEMDRSVAALDQKVFDAFDKLDLLSPAARTLSEEVDDRRKKRRAVFGEEVVPPGVVGGGAGSCQCRKAPICNFRCPCERAGQKCGPNCLCGVDCRSVFAKK